MQQKKWQAGNQLERILNQAWQKRQANFPDTIEFVTPGRTLPVSVTGTACSLNCAHCSGVYLRNMVSLNTTLAGPAGEESSYLVSGGSDKHGRVPLLDNWTKLKKLAERGPLNLHTGLVNEEEARQLADVAAVVSFDFVGDNDTIAAVYGLPVTVEDYLDSYRFLQKYSRVIPHLCIGLNKGRIKSEYEALQMLRQEKVEAISMIIFRPTAETAFSDCLPPPPEEVAYFIASARLMFPHTPLYLGCMRPGGRYREQVDVYALKAGVNKIVIPSPAARRQVIRLGLTVSLSEECCSL